MSTPRDRRFLTLKLLPNDRELIQDLGRNRPGFADRHEAFLALVPIVAALDLEPVGKRRDIRVGLPTELLEALEKKAETTGASVVSILLQAAREFQRRHPASEPTPAAEPETITTTRYWAVLAERELKGRGAGRVELTCAKPTKTKPDTRAKPGQKIVVIQPSGLAHWRDQDWAVLSCEETETLKLKLSPKQVDKDAARPVVITVS